MPQQYDVAIIGGGLAGLASSILLKRAGFAVVLFEKEAYPFHRVCGEYISNESLNFLVELGLPLKNMQLPIINQLLLTSPNGKIFETELPLGGFGVSRYTIDHLLANVAKQQGVDVMEQTKVDDVRFGETFDISISSGFHTIKKIQSHVCLSAHGKRSNIDVRLKRSFLSDRSHGLQNYVGVKYHLQSSWPADTIGLHNFKNGYCGISKIEDDKTSLCYMTTAQNLKQCNNSIPMLEDKVLSQNPHLKKIFAEAIVDKHFPITISQISFSKKTQVENGMLMIGDAAGMITPLCGNGMSIALHSAKLATEVVALFLAGKISRSQMENNYAANWKQQFAARLNTGRTLQKFFGSPLLSNAFVSLFKTFPFLAKPVIKQTHGANF